MKLAQSTKKISASTTMIAWLGLLFSLFSLLFNYYLVQRRSAENEEQKTTLESLKSLPTLTKLITDLRPNIELSAIVSRKEKNDDISVTIRNNGAHHITVTSAIYNKVNKLADNYSIVRTIGKLAPDSNDDFFKQGIAPGTSVSFRTEKELDREKLGYGKIREISYDFIFQTDPVVLKTAILDLKKLLTEKEIKELTRRETSYKLKINESGEYENLNNSSLK